MPLMADETYKSRMYCDSAVLMSDHCRLDESVRSHLARTWQATACATTGTLQFILARSCLSIFPETTHFTLRRPPEL